MHYALFSLRNRRGMSQVCSVDSFFLLLYVFPTAWLARAPGVQHTVGQTAPRRCVTRQLLSRLSFTMHSRPFSLKKKRSAYDVQPLDT